MPPGEPCPDRKSTRLNSSHLGISYAVFCLKKKKKTNTPPFKLIQKEHAQRSINDQRVTRLDPSVVGSWVQRLCCCVSFAVFFFFFFNDTATTEIYTLSLHDALPI